MECPQMDMGLFKNAGCSNIIHFKVKPYNKPHKNPCCGCGYLVFKQTHMSLCMYYSVYIYTVHIHDIYIYIYTHTFIHIHMRLLKSSIHPNIHKFWQYWGMLYLWNYHIYINYSIYLITFHKISPLWPFWLVSLGVGVILCHGHPTKSP